jgi:hypothetical protein
MISPVTQFLARSTASSDPAARCAADGPGSAARADWLLSRRMVSAPRSGVSVRIQVPGIVPRGPANSAGGGTGAIGPLDDTVGVYRMARSNSRGLSNS